MGNSVQSLSLLVPLELCWAQETPKGQALVLCELQLNFFMYIHVHYVQHTMCSSLFFNYVRVIVKIAAENFLFNVNSYY